MAGPDIEHNLGQGTPDQEQNPHEQQFVTVPVTLPGGWKLVRDGYRQSIDPGYEQRDPVSEEELERATAIKIVEEAIEVLGVITSPLDRKDPARREFIRAELADLRDAAVTLLDLTGLVASGVRQARVDKAERIGRFNHGLLQREATREEPQL